jgi:hypothetical protein
METKLKATYNLCKIALKTQLHFQNSCTTKLRGVCVRERERDKERAGHNSSGKHTVPDLDFEILNGKPLYLRIEVSRCLEISITKWTLELLFMQS